MTTRKTKPLDGHASKHAFSLISNKKLRALYAAMLKGRMLQERARLLSAGKSRAASSGSGHEASAAAVVIDLSPNDVLCTPRGELAPGFLKGVPLRRIFSAFVSSRRSSFKTISSREVDANVLPVENLADRLELALRAARLEAQRKSKNITALILGSAEIAEGLWEESLRAASAERLPVLFVCHSSRRKTDLTHQAQRCGLPGIAVDEADAVAIYRVVSEAMAHARRGNGPTLIECKRWTVRGTKPSQQSGDGNALRNMETYLAGKGLFSREFKAEVVSQFRRELDKAGSRKRASAS